MSTPSHDAASSSRSTDVHAAVAQWRAAHPAATLAEIEHAVDTHLSAERAALITATAQAEPTGERPVCAECGTPLQRVGTRARHLRTAHGGELVFTEPAWRCPACGAGLFPPD